MNAYRFHDLVIGQSEEIDVVITQDKMEAFRQLSGDINPLHNDEAFAIDQGYPGKVVYGMLTATMISTLWGVVLPGKYGVIQRLECKFLSPVFIGDVLRVQGTIKELIESVQQAVIKIEIKNQAETKVVKATLYVSFFEQGR